MRLNPAAAISSYSAHLLRGVSISGMRSTARKQLLSSPKPETDFSEAVIEHQLAYYDVEHTHTYQTQTGDLLLMQARWLEQFFTSPKIQLAQKINGTNPLVLIADYEHQITDAPGRKLHPHKSKPNPNASNTFAPGTIR